MQIQGPNKHLPSPFFNFRNIVVNVAKAAINPDCDASKPFLCTRRKALQAGGSAALVITNPHLLTSASAVANTAKTAYGVLPGLLTRSLSPGKLLFLLAFGRTFPDVKDSSESCDAPENLDDYAFRFVHLMWKNLKVNPNSVMLPDINTGIALETIWPTLPVLESKDDYSETDKGHFEAALKSARATERKNAAFIANCPELKDYFLMVAKELGIKIPPSINMEKLIYGLLTKGKLRSIAAEVHKFALDNLSEYLGVAREIGKRHSLAGQALEVLFKQGPKSLEQNPWFSARLEHMDIATKIRALRKIGGQEDKIKELEARRNEIGKKIREMRGEKTPEQTEPKKAKYSKQPSGYQVVLKSYNYKRERIDEHLYFRPAFSVEVFNV